MVAPLIKLDQSGKPAGVAGRAREDCDVGINPVIATAVGGPYLAYKWTLLDVGEDIETGTRSTATPSSPTIGATNVSPINVAGTYHLMLEVDQGQGLGARPEDRTFITFYAGPALAGDPRELPRREPSFLEQLAHNVVDAIFPAGNPLGWAQEMKRWFALVRRLYRGMQTLRVCADGTGQVQGVLVTPGWTTLRAFPLESNLSRLNLDVMHFVSQGALTSRVRLFDLTGLAVVAGSELSTSALVETRQTSGDLASLLTVGRTYQLQAECTGGNLPADFSIVRYVTLRGV